MHDLMERVALEQEKIQDALVNTSTLMALAKASERRAQRIGELEKLIELAKNLGDARAVDAAMLELGNMLKATLDEGSVPP